MPTQVVALPLASTTHTQYLYDVRVVQLAHGRELLGEELGVLLHVVVQIQVQHFNRDGRAAPPRLADHTEHSATRVRGGWC